MNLPTLITIPKADICKAEIAQIAQQLTDRINEGEVNPIEAHIKLKAIVKALEVTIKATEQTVADEASKHGKTFQAFGAEVTLKEGSLTPNYEEDAVYADLKAQLKEREEILKLAFRQAGKSAIFDEVTGEQIPVCTAKGTKSSIAVSFK
ncbi:MAG: hypothetical protein EB117_13335 [Betaproteobacteria bacterium]|nr:hypothetical protein [Betaproteobacteria bacterium]